MSQIILQHDWSKSSLGCFERWPQSLCTTLNNLLHSAFPMFLFWGDDFICFYNDAFRPSLGGEGKHPAIGKKGMEVWSDTWDFVGPLINKVYQTGEPCWFEDQLVSFYRNGKVEDIYWTFSYSPAFGDSNEICGVLVTCIETTSKVLAAKKIEEQVTARTKELVATQQSLTQANVYLQQIINSFKEPLQVLEPIVVDGDIIDFRFKLTNAAYSAYADTTPEGLHDKKVGDVFPGYFKTSSFFNLVRTFQTGTPETWEIHYDQDGLNLYNEMSTTKLGNEVVVHFTNFTKLKNLQLELVKKIDELERSNKSLEAFANAVSHDLKSPIRKINIFTSKLKSQLTQYLTKNDVEIFFKIEKAVSRMDLLIEDLLQFAHVNDLPLEKEVVNLNDSVRQVLEDLEVEVQQKKAIVKVQELPHVKGYTRQLQQLLQNLISNSLKYCKKDVAPEIHITSTMVREEGTVFNVIHVSDNGIGFDQEFEKKIFNIFTRLHSADQYNGNGIGLSIVKKITENHQGKIVVKSQHGIGSTFTVYLPEK